MAEIQHQDVIDLVDRLESSARGRFVRWDPKLWSALVSGPAAQLAEAGGGALLVENYLRLACEAVGLGYLFPTEAGYENFFTLAWTRLVPTLLPKLPAERQPEILAALWNLGENLEASPAWLRRIFHRMCRSLTSLDALPQIVDRIARLALEPPEGKLGPETREVWVDLAEEDPRFLPGALHFVAPTVVCVHDRRRTAASGGDPVTLGVWLAEAPLVLGPMGCREPAGGTDVGRRGVQTLWKRAAKRDPRVTELHAVVMNDHRAAGTLITSQRLVVIEPVK